MRDLDSLQLSGFEQAIYWLVTLLVIAICFACGLSSEERYAPKRGKRD